ATVISADAAKQLQLRGRKETVYVSTLLERKEEELEVVKFVLQSATGDGEKITVEEGLISQKFNINESLPENIDKNEHPHLADIVIPIVDIPRVSVVIGKDVDEAHEVLEVRLPTQPTSKLQGQLGPLGWVITGTLSGDQGHRTELNVNFTDIENKNLREQIEKFWKIETYGTRNEVEELQPESLSREDVRAVEILDKTTRLTDDGHYETGLLWKRDATNLPNNREQAEKRLMNLKRKFKKDASYEDLYRSTMDGYIQKGHARKLSKEEVSTTQGPRTWYLPHFGVTNEHKPGKVRIVFDAAAEFNDWIKNRSLQKNVEKAPEVQKRICQDDIERAKKRVAAIVQRKTYPDEVKYLSEGKRVKASSEIVRLKPVMKGDRVVRVGGRISMAPISEDAMNPMILPKEHHITTILIRHIHQRNGHCGVEQTLCILREQFWVVKARMAIKKVLGKCIPCRKRMAPKAQQEMASLPKIRLTPYEPPFTYAGVDYFGPLWVKRGRGRVMEKRWGAIFVCMNTRAVHLEVAKSLETDDFILVLMRFLNRRGHVKELRSDNGTNFVGAEREITESIKKMDHDKLGRELIKRGCNWVFHPPGASHMSGVWERLVRTVKRSLKAILGNSPMNDEVLSTVFTEAERIANSRPLTRNPLSPNDDDPLTPNHFLNIRPTANMPTEVYDETDKYSKRKWRQAQLLSDHYWKRWLK
ncbi:hypothetical protein QZH41_015132, partial [Actinostola sp. cb2023]